MVVLLIGIACKSVAPDVDWSVKTVEASEESALTVSILQSSLEWFFAELSAMRVSELLMVEAELRSMDAGCPEVFDGVSDSIAWNNVCSNQYEVDFDGRSQSMYGTERDWEGAFYTEVASYISAYTIGSESEGWSFRVNGYGDIRHDDIKNWMEIVGTYDADGLDVSWPSTAQSVAVHFERMDNGLIVEGGISQSRMYTEPIVSIRATDCIITEVSLDCTVIAQSALGEQRSVSLSGDLADCVQSDDGELCWDVRDLWGMTW